MDLSFSDLNYNSVVIDTVAMLPSIETLPGFEARKRTTVVFVIHVTELQYFCDKSNFVNLLSSNLSICAIPAFRDGGGGMSENAGCGLFALREDGRCFALCCRI